MSAAKHILPDDPRVLAAAERLAPEALDALLADPAVRDDLRAATSAASKVEAQFARVRLAEKGLYDLPADPEPTPPPRASLALVQGPDVSQGNPRPGTNRGPTVNHAAEAGVQAAFLQRPELRADLAATLEPGHFSGAMRRVLWEQLCELHASGEPFDGAVLLDALTRSGRLARVGGPEAVAHLARTPVDPTIVQRQAAIVRENAEDRAFLETLEQTREEFLSGKAPRAAVASAFREAIERVELQGEVAPSVDMRQWPAPPAEEAWDGVAGELVRLIEPQTEADPIAILAQFLVCFGSVIGRNAHWSVNATEHFCNLNLAIAGPSGMGLKGTSWDIVDALMGRLDSEWRGNCIQSGLSTGEGLIWAVRDPGRVDGDNDPGVVDKRCLWIETEFTRTIGCMQRDKNVLMEVVCQAFDGKALKSSPKGNPMRCAKPHVSIIAHTTVKVIRTMLSDTLRGSGFTNRFLWVCSRRSKELPFGGDIRSINLTKPLRRLAKAVAFASDPRLASCPIEMTAEATELYTSLYPVLRRERVGGAAPFLERAAPLVRRLAVLYALLDCRYEVDLPHLNSALAFWDYCERSVEFLFGDPIKDPSNQKVLDAIRAAGPDGILKSDLLRQLKKTAKEIDASLDRLSAEGLVESRVVKTKGRPSVYWFVPHLLLGGCKKGKKSHSSTEAISA